MVVKATSAPNSPKASDASASPAADPLRGVRSADHPSGGDGKITKKSKDCVDTEFSRLKNLVPAISRKSTVSKLDVILEAIRYIDSLQDQLVDQIAENRISLSATSLLVGKENTDSALLASLQAHSDSLKKRK